MAGNNVFWPLMSLEADEGDKGPDELPRREKCSVQRVGFFARSSASCGAPVLDRNANESILSGNDRPM
jgi:hypothetical protein